MKKYFVSVLLVLVFIFTSCSFRDAESDGRVTLNGPDTDPVFTSSATEVPPETQTSPSTDFLTEDSVAETYLPVESVSEQTETDPIYPSREYVPKAMMYHLIMETPYNSLEALFVRPSDFDSQLKYLTENGYGFMFADEWQIADKPTVIITFDDGYADNYTDMFPILKKYGAKATVFLISESVDTDGYLTVSQIREMASSGLVSFQCHTANHVDLAYQDEATIRSEFSGSIAKIESWTGRPVKALAYPAGSYNETVIRIAADYFSFCYTTKSPYSVTDYSSFDIP
ncbi:MAG: polysaccharide deacetylase family protein, partial [Clostridia bacterium]|nr:polysaccharide deacetylase family protein [Clostridia bacterium]